MRKWATVFTGLILVVATATTKFLELRAEKCREGSVQGGLALTCPGATSRRLFRSSRPEPRAPEEIPLSRGRHTPRPGVNAFANTRTPDMRPRLLYRLSGPGSSGN